MSESTLSLTYTKLVTEVSYRLGYGRATAPTGDDLTHVQDVISRGLRQIYFNSGHSWRCLKPLLDVELWSDVTGTTSGSQTTTVTATAAKFYSTMIGRSITFDTSGTDYTITAVGTGGTPTTAVATCTVSTTAAAEASDDTFTITSTGDYRLPDYFGGAIGPVTFDYNEGFVPFNFTNIAEVLRQREYYNGTGRPYMAACEPLTTDGSSGQRFDLLVFPIPDSNYTSHFRINTLPNALVSSTNEYPFGGAMLSEAILASCLDVAESEVQQVPGIYHQRYLEALATAVIADKKAGPERLGPNLDRQMRSYPEAQDVLRDSTISSVTYNGSSIPGV